MKETSKTNTIEVQANGLDGSDKILSLGAKVSLQSVYEFSECPDRKEGGNLLGTHQQPGILNRA